MARAKKATPFPLPFPAAAMQDSGAILGKKGSGKSSTARVLLEHELDVGHRCVLVDPMGDSTGIKLNPDMTPSRFKDVVIFGGPHADIPLSHEDGRKAARIIGGSAISCIIDLSNMLDTHQRTFMSAFAEELYETIKVPMLLMVDEAHDFAPQEKGTVSGTLLNRMRRLTTQGRKRGIFLWVMTQRPARIDKTLLSQTESLIAMKVGIKHDADAITDWLELHVADKAHQARAQLSKLKPGEAFVSFPAGGGYFERIQFPMHSTLDTGKTPRHGETIGGVAIPKTEVSELATLFGKMATGDPKDDEIKALRQDLADVRQSLSDARATIRDQADKLAAARRVETRVLEILVALQMRIGAAIGSAEIEALPLGEPYEKYLMVPGEDGVVRPLPREGDNKTLVAGARRRITRAKAPETPKGKK
jgi:hypothetical protein